MFRHASRIFKEIKPVEASFIKDLRAKVESLVQEGNIRSCVKNLKNFLYKYNAKEFTLTNIKSFSISKHNLKPTPNLNPLDEKLNKIKNSHKGNLYIPDKDLIFINHPKYGKVYPVYIADREYNKSNNPRKYFPFTLLFSSFNLFILLSGLQVLPVTYLYEIVYSNDLILLSSVVVNYLLLKKYFTFVGNYESRVRCLYLLPSGDKLILETFDATKKEFEVFDIYEFNIRNKFQDLENKTIKWNPLFFNNDNNFRCHIKWGRASENYFEGKTIIFDYEIFSQIVSRTNIDTQIKKFKRQIPLNYYTNEDKIKIIKKFQNRWHIEKIDRNRLSYHYKLLKHKYIDKQKKSIINNEFNFY